MSRSSADTPTAEALVPIQEVSRRLGIPSSTIRYYDERNLVTPTSRHAGRRWYNAHAIRHLAIVRYWQGAGLLSLDDIAEVLAGPGRNRRWHAILRTRITALEAKIVELRDAADLIEHILDHHPDESPDGCPHYEHLIFDEDPDAVADVPTRRSGDRSENRF